MLNAVEIRTTHEAPVVLVLVVVPVELPVPLLLLLLVVELEDVDEEMASSIENDDVCV